MKKDVIQPRALAELEDEILTLAGHMNAGEYRLLELIHELDQREDWAGPGLKSLAHWLNWRIGLALGAAREKVRVANALPALPMISAAFRRGEVSYSKVRAMTRVATPQNEAFFIELARHATAAHVERIVRSYRFVQREDASDMAARQHARRAVDYYFDADGMLQVRAVLPPEEAMGFIKALELAAEDIRRECESEDEADARVVRAREAQAREVHDREPLRVDSPRNDTRCGHCLDSEPQPGKPEPGQSQPAASQPDATQANATQPNATQANGVQHRERAKQESGVAACGSTVRDLLGVSAETSAPEPAAPEPARHLSHWLHYYAGAESKAGALRADALARLSGHYVGVRRPHQSTANRHELIVHVNAGLLSAAGYPDDGSKPAAAHYHEGPGIAPETARRLACDAAVRALVTGSNGRILNLGRRQRVVSPALRRALELRDRGCRFPGCTQQHRLHAHHVEHWADGGKTALSNLVHLCSYHHHLVHEGGFSIGSTHDGAFEFRDTRGVPVPVAPDGLASSCAGATALQRANSEAQLTITAETADCYWTGERMDLGMVVAHLQHDDASARATPGP